MFLGFYRKKIPSHLFLFFIASVGFLPAMADPEFLGPGWTVRGGQWAGWRATPKLGK